MPSVKQLVDICHKVYEKGFVSAFDGNISYITPQNTILITRSAVCKGDVTENDILEIDVTGNILNGKGKISTEYKIHLYTYSRRPEVNSVVHCHPTYATAFASIGEGLTQNIFPEVILTLGKVPLCKYATPSTDELPLSLEPYIEHSWALLLQNHGAVTLGRSLRDAYFKMEKLEHAAKTMFVAKMMGGANELPKEKINELLSLAKGTYGLSQDERNVF
ncbi:MAG TPA: class II aldolase/adducin family protein [Ignavibacteriaceae bacterium]|nr:class II aldolase/adducin family protein [Ignavibacteriaceae bacterium]